MKNIIYFMGLLALLLVASCDHESENRLLTQPEDIVNVTGKWEMAAYNDTTLVFGPFNVLTVKNPLTGSDSITIQDCETKFWEFQVKAALNEAAGTFQTKLSASETSKEGIGVIISNGRITSEDSIFFHIQFEDDVTPFGNTYQLKGRRINL